VDSDTAGSYLVTVTVTDSSAPTRQTASQQFTIIINPSTLAVTCSAPLSGTVGTPYFWSTCTPSGGTAPYAWSWSGTIPPGLFHQFQHWSRQWDSDHAGLIGHSHGQR